MRTIINDIAKDHPDLVAGLAAEWMRDAGPERKRLIRHACRGLVKAGHPGALAALGYAAPEVVVDAFSVATPEVRFGGALEFRARLRSTATDRRALVIDYAVYHRKANGTLRAKVFKLRGLELDAGEVVEIARRHPIRAITTRVYYDGPQAVELLVNGVPIAREGFTLVGADEAPTSRRTGAIRP